MTKIHFNRFVSSVLSGCEWEKCAYHLLRMEIVVFDRIRLGRVYYSVDKRPLDDLDLFKRDQRLHFVFCLLSSVEFYRPNK